MEILLKPQEIIFCLYTHHIGLKRSDFDNRQVTFKEHVHREHWMWNYLHFYVLLEEKAPTELTGPESYVKKLIQVASILSFLFMMLKHLYIRI